MSEISETRPSPNPEKMAALRAQLEAGDFWRVRESARGLRVTYGYNGDLFALEAEAALAMGDLPAAGALLYLHGADLHGADLHGADLDGADVLKDAAPDQAKNAVDIFRHRCGSDPTCMAVQAGLLRYWLTLPDERLRALRDEMGEADWNRLRTHFERSHAGTSRYAKRKASGGESAPTGPIELKSIPGFAIIFFLFLLFAFIGFLTVFVFVIEAVKTNYM